MWATNRIPRFVCAGILLVAAGFKGYELVADPALGTLYGSRWLQLLLIEYEVLLASWLLSGVAQHACRWVALVTFATFGCYALYFGLTGAASCGCFGRAQVSPWWTFGLDGAALLLLWRWKPTAAVVRVSRLASCAALPTVVGAVLAILVVMQSGAAAADGIVEGDSFVLLEPETWIGKSFLLVDQIEIGERLGRGSWKLLFYHHDCPKCQEVLAKLPKDFGGEASLALIEVPPFGPVEFTGCGSRGRLKGDKQWFVKTPVEISLYEGRVVGIASEEDLLCRILVSPVIE